MDSSAKRSRLFTTRAIVDFDNERRSFSTDGLEVTLYEAILFQPLFHLL